MAIPFQYEVEAVTGVLLRWAQNKGVRSYVTDDEANNLSIELIEELDTVRAARRPKEK